MTIARTIGRGKSTNPLAFGNCVLWVDSANSNSYPGSGTTWTDLSGAGNNGTIANAPTFSNGVFTLDGSSQYFTFGTGFNYTSGEFSFAFWVNCTSLTNSPVVWYKGAFKSAGYYAGLGSDGSAYISTNQSNASQQSFSAAASVGTNAWAMLGFTRSGSSCGIYVNGADVTSTAATHSNPTTSAAAATLGRYSGGPSSYFTGKVAIAMGWSAALTAAQMASLFAAYRNRFGV